LGERGARLETITFWAKTGKRNVGTGNEKGISTHEGAMSERGSVEKVDPHRPAIGGSLVKAESENSLGGCEGRMGFIEKRHNRHKRKTKTEAKQKEHDKHKVLARYSSLYQKSGDRKPGKNINHAQGSHQRWSRTQEQLRLVKGGPVSSTIARRRDLWAEKISWKKKRGTG